MALGLSRCLCLTFMILIRFVPLADPIIQPLYEGVYTQRGTGISRRLSDSLSLWID